MGAKHSKPRHRHRYSHPTNTTFEQDAAIGGAGGAVVGLATGLGYMFVNAVGLRASVTLMGFAIIGGTIVGAIVCVAGTLAVKSLAWLYRQLRKRTRQGMEVQLSVVSGAMAGGGGGSSSNNEEVQAALEEARGERARALEELHRYDQLLAEAEHRLRQSLPASGGAAAVGARTPAAATTTTVGVPIGEEEPPHVAPVPARVMPPPDFFQAQPVHITLRLRDHGGGSTEGDSSDDNTEEGAEGSYYFVEDEEEGGGLAATAVGDARRRASTPPIY